MRLNYADRFHDYDYIFQPIDYNYSRLHVE
jgi:hypothetical protein